MEKRLVEKGRKSPIASNPWVEASQGIQDKKHLDVIDEFLGKKISSIRKLG